jgi:crotonobetainyl-CoA hydratase/dehydration protein DpgD
MDAATALHFGLVNDVVPVTDLDDCVDGWVQDLVRGAPLSTRAIKQAAYASVDMPLELAFRTGFPREEARRRSEDAREGPRAFAERREPKWLGR